MDVNQFCIEQYKELCPFSSHKVKFDDKDIFYKIMRAAELGHTDFRFRNGSKIVHYHNMNFLVTKPGGVMRMWKDEPGTKEYKVSERLKKIHKRETFKAYKQLVTV